MALIESIQLKKLEKIISLNDCAEEFKIVQIEKALLQKYSFSGGSTAAHKVEKKLSKCLIFFEDVSEHEYKKIKFTYWQGLNRPDFSRHFIAL